MDQRIRFCTTRDGVRLAYASHGQGPALVKVANWLTHLEHDWESPVWRHWLADLGRGHRMVRYDGRGCGLSDRDPGDLTPEALVDDLATVVEAAGLDRFALVGISQGGAVAAAYAARHPDRVTGLVLCGSYARGRSRRGLDRRQQEESELLEQIMQVGWGRPDPAFRRIFTMRFLPDATAEQMEWFDELQRLSTSPGTAVRLRRTWGDLDVQDLLPRIRARTLVAHARGDQVVPFDEGRTLAAGIHDADFLPLETTSHLLLQQDDAWPVFLEAARDLLGSPGPGAASTVELSGREREVLELVAAGLGNDEIADRLTLSPRTVERHLSNCYAKLGVTGRTARAAAAAYVARTGER